MIYRNPGLREVPTSDVGSGRVPESPKTTIRWDEGLKSDAERCAQDRNIAVAEFIRQSIAHYVAWCAASKSAEGLDADKP